MNNNKIISIVYDSKYGSNKQIAEAIYNKLTNKDNLSIHLIHVKDINKHWKDINNSDGIIFGCPTFFGGVSAGFKTFMESSSVYFSGQKWKDKLVTGFTCSGSASGDKMNTLIQLFIFASQHGMTWVSLGKGDAGSYFEEDNEYNINRFGCWIGAMAQVKKNPKANDRICISDLKTAEYLGERVANLIL